jgi:hypothetical protein
MPRISVCRVLLLILLPHYFDTRFLLFIMQIQTHKARIIMAIEAIRTSKRKMSRRAAAKLYNVPETTLRD